MAGLKVALFCGCLALVAGRTITVQKTSMSLTEQSEEADALNDILRTFLFSSDVTSDEQDGGIIQGCSKGKCEFCKAMLKLELCFVASIEGDSIVLEVTLNGWRLFKIVISGPVSTEVCKETVPYFPSVTDVCVQVKDVNLQQPSGCVHVSFKVKGKEVSKKVGVFKIPTNAGLKQIPEAESVKGKEVSKKVGVFKIPTSAVLTQITEAESVENEDQGVGAAMLDGAVLEFETMDSIS